MFNSGYQPGCQSDVSSGLGAGAVWALRGVVRGRPSVGIAGQLTGFIQTSIQPRVIVDVSMANMALTPGGRAMTSTTRTSKLILCCGAAEIADTTGSAATNPLAFLP